MSSTRTPFTPTFPKLETKSMVAKTQGNSDFLPSPLDVDSQHITNRTKEASTISNKVSTSSRKEQDDGFSSLTPNASSNMTAVTPMSVTTSNDEADIAEDAVESSQVGEPEKTLAEETNTNLNIPNGDTTDKTTSASPKENEGSTLNTANETPNDTKSKDENLEDKSSANDSSLKPTPPPQPGRPAKFERQNTKTKLAKIGFYELGETLGEGNFAKVRLGTHVLTGEPVAVKIIDKTKLDKVTQKKLYREVRIMKLLNHPNIVRLYEVIDTPRALHLIMEYAQGGEVFDYLVAHGRMKERDARKHFRQIISAVEYCHSLHVIHRDLKAENLLLDEKLNVKIADFGFSNQFNPGETLNTWCGSPPYAAPELFEGRDYSGPEVDIWSLGVVLYVLVCGCLPFDGSTMQKLRARVIAGRYRIPFYMSTECEGLIKKMLQVDPAKRIPIADLKKDKWFNEGFENEQLPSLEQLTLTDEQKEQVLDEIEKMGIERANIEKSINEKSYDYLAATYYLIADRLFRKKTPLNKDKQAGLRSRASSRYSQHHRNDSNSQKKPHDDSQKPQSTPTKRDNQDAIPPTKETVNEESKSTAKPENHQLSPLIIATGAPENIDVSNGAFNSNSLPRSPKVSEAPNMNVISEESPNGQTQNKTRNPNIIGNSLADDETYPSPVITGATHSRQGSGVVTHGSLLRRKREDSTSYDASPTMGRAPTVTSGSTIPQVSSPLAPSTTNNAASGSPRRRATVSTPMGVQELRNEIFKDNGTPNKSPMLTGAVARRQETYNSVRGTSTPASPRLGGRFFARLTQKESSSRVSVESNVQNEGTSSNSSQVSLAERLRYRLRGFGKSIPTTSNTSSNNTSEGNSTDGSADSCAITYNGSDVINSIAHSEMSNTTSPSSGTSGMTMNSGNSEDDDSFKEMKSVFAFLISSTTNLPPSDALAELVRAAKEAGYTTETTSEFTVTIEASTVTFAADVIRVRGTPTPSFGIRTRRMRGNPWAYKRAVGDVFGIAKLTV